MSDTISETIRESQLFAHLNDDQMQQILASATLITLGSDDALIREGTKVESLFVIASGSVEVFTNALGRRVELTKLGPGAYVGEVSLLSGKTATATVRALDSAEVVAISRETVLALVADDEVLRNTLEGVTLARAKDTLGKVLQ